MTTDEQLALLAVNAVSVGVLVTDRNGILLFVNKRMADIFGYETGELVGKSIDILIPHESRPTHRDLLRGFMSTPESRTMGMGREVRGLRKDGTAIPLEVSLDPVCTGDGLAIVASAVIDITQRNKIESDRLQYEDKLRTMQKLESMGALAGGVAHDFNNLLMGVLGNADLALAIMPGDTPGRARVRAIAEAAGRASELCKQLLAYSGRGKFVVEAVDLTALLGEACALLDSTLPSGVTVKTEYGKSLPAVEADITQLRQVAMNLVLNAAEAIGKNEGVVTLRTGTMACDLAYLSNCEPGTGGVAQQGQYVYLEVADTGGGIEDAVRSRMFDPFFTTKPCGSGLGLAAVLGIIRSHKGALRVETESGKGTTLRVLLPASDRPARSTSRPPGRPDWRGAGVGLVVDDMQVVRDVAKLMLERCGFTVLTADSGEQCLQMVGKLKGELAFVLLDMSMPGLSGLATFARLRELRPGIPVIFSSGFNQQDLVPGLHVESATFLQKPYDLGGLVKVLRELLRDTEN